MSNGLLPSGLTREQVIRMSGSTAQLEYRPAPAEPLRYHYGPEQQEIEAATRADWHVIVGLVLCGLSAQFVGASYGITRQAVEKRLHALPDGFAMLRRPLVVSQEKMLEASGIEHPMTPAEAGRIGGPKRMASLTPDQRRELAKAGARARWGSRRRSRS